MMTVNVCRKTPSKKLAPRRPGKHGNGRGRSRDLGVDEAIISATLAPLDEHGYAGLSLAQVANQAAYLRRTVMPEASFGSVDRAMRSLGLCGVRRDKGIRTTIPARDGIRAGDLLDRDFTAAAPNRVWITDFTYVRTWAGFVYVAFIVDVYAQRIVAWHAATTKQTDLVMIPLRMALWQRGREGHPTIAGELIHHSDAGSQYTSLRLTEHLTLQEIRPSIGSVGDAYDNALMETINGLYKAECIRTTVFHQGPYKTIADVEYATAGWVDWYNARRLHSTLGSVPPIEYEQAHYAALTESPTPYRNDREPGAPHYADVYTLTGNRNIDHAAAREALLATSNHRGADVVALSRAIGDFVGWRGRAYAAYRAGLGPDGTRLPEDFGMVVNAVVAFADRLAEEAPSTTRWDATTRQWFTSSATRSLDAWLPATAHGRLLQVPNAKRPASATATNRTRESRSAVQRASGCRSGQGIGTRGGLAHSFLQALQTAWGCPAVVG